MHEVLRIALAHQCTFDLAPGERETHARAVGARGRLCRQSPAGARTGHQRSRSTSGGARSHMGARKTRKSPGASAAPAAALRRLAPRRSGPPDGFWGLRHCREEQRDHREALARPISAVHEMFGAARSLPPAVGPFRSELWLGIPFVWSARSGHAPPPRRSVTVWAASPRSATPPCGPTRRMDAVPCSFGSAARAAGSACTTAGVRSILRQLIKAKTHAFERRFMGVRFRYSILPARPPRAPRGTRVTRHRTQK